MNRRTIVQLFAVALVWTSTAAAQTWPHAGDGLPELNVLDRHPWSWPGQAPRSAMVTPVQVGPPPMPAIGDLAPAQLPAANGGCQDCGDLESAGNAVDCDTYAACPVTDTCPWFASVSGLVMTRDKPNRLWTTYETNNNPNQLMTPPNAKWAGGGEVRFGRWFCCHRWGLEARYWTLDPFTASSSMSHPNSVSTPLIFSDLEFAGDLVEDFYDGAAEHRIWRSDELHNVELNVVSGDLLLGSEFWSFSGLVGVRYFRFRENLVFSALDLGGTWGGNGGIDEAYLNDRIENDLVGVQVGAMVARRCWDNWRLYVAPQVGIYNNHIQHRLALYRGDGTTASPTAGSGVAGSYPVNSSTNVVSFLSQIDIGLDWQFTPHWSAMVGYRVLAITGVGLADNQIPPYVVDIPEIAAIDHDGDLVLHGGFAGLTWSF